MVTLITPLTHFKSASCTGYTLFELLIAFIIIIIISTLSIPTLNYFLITINVNHQVKRAHGHMIQSRQMALLNEHKVTVCPLDNNNTCHNNWQHGFSAFSDFDELGVLNTDSDTLIYNYKPSIAGLWSYNGGKYIIFDETGNLYSASGTFQYCHNQDSTGQYSKAIIINFNGRARLSQDVDNDGFDEKHYTDKDSDLTCNS